MGSKGVDTCFTGQDLGYEIAQSGQGLLRSLRGETEGTLGYSHSMVAGGFDEMSSVTRLQPRTSLMMRLLTLPSSS